MQLNKFTFCGRISANMINGSGKIPKQVAKMYVEKLTNGIQFNSSRWKPFLLRYENAPNEVSPMNAPVAEYVKSVFRPIRSTQYPDAYTPQICMTAITMPHV